MRIGTLIAYNKGVALRKMRKIVFLYTDFQRAVFLSVLETKMDDLSEFIIFRSNGVENVDGTINFLIKNKSRGFSIRSARALIKELKSLLTEAISKDQFQFWLANEDNAIAQILYNHQQCQSVIFFEDGLGSYVEHGYFDLNKGWRSTFARVRNILYLFPHYRALRLGGARHKVQEVWGLFSTAFPRVLSTNLINHQFFKENLFNKKAIQNHDISFSSKKIFIFLDQPLIEDHLLNEDEYRQTLNSLFHNINIDLSEFLIFFKAHPRSNSSVFNQNLSFLKESGSLDIKPFPFEGNIESFLPLIESDQIILASFCSTSLYTASIFNLKTDTYCCNSHSLNQAKPYIKSYIEALKHLNVNVVDCI